MRNRKHYPILCFFMLVASAVLIYFIAEQYKAQPVRYSPVSEFSPADHVQISPAPKVTMVDVTGDWENSDGDKFRMTQSGSRVDVRLIESQRLASGRGVLEAKGNQLFGDLFGVPIDDRVPIRTRVIGTRSASGSFVFEVTVLPAGPSRVVSVWRFGQKPSSTDTNDGRVVAKVVSVTDGDTLSISVQNESIKVRLSGIDAPELDQSFGFEAKQKLEQMVSGKTVRLRTQGYDAYERLLAELFVEMSSQGKQASINLQMIESGHAWHYVRYAKNRQDLSNAEYFARKAKRGLWKEDSPLAPWEFRRMK